MTEKTYTRRGLVTETAREYAQTSLESALMITANKLLLEALNESGIRAGGRSINREQVQQLLRLDLGRILYTCVVAPLNETLVYDYLPSWQIDEADKTRPIHERGKLHMDKGLVSAAIFALIHNFSQKDGSLSSFKFETDSIPITQFTSGLLYWYLTRTRGASHAALAHMQNNAVAVALMKMFP